ncbi:relaxase/mobilization nuclease domain-containing protein [Chelatococcus sp. YT9]|uniref:relaxase/mobilization nuclease domain-containing protein n=1 Tax=Chelatococcus sp. YT9 TaxID=2835635 RepID=UPI001BCE0D31|nr:relaxase/mobilization nuclease domain-containing protein [Chelatococcus sp. YT9]
MNFQLAPIGHSFKGSMAYYLHDKRQEGDAQHPQTAERVAWTETRNLPTDGPQTAMRIMIATASQADALKAAAGIKSTGRKATAGPVFAFSLAWHPSESDALDRAEMTRAADHALKVLGLDHLQAVLVAHRDTAHPHVHVIVNRVDPNTGKTEPIRKPAVLALDKWADRYEKERGKIVSPNRAEKYDEIERKRAQHQDRQKRRDHDRQRRQDAQARPVSEKSPGAMLKELHDAQKARHRQEWKDLGRADKAARDQIYTAFGGRMKEAAALHKAECKPIWAAHFRQARDSRRAFERRERNLAGVIVNAMMATTQQKISGQLGNRGVLSATFGNALSSQARAAAFAAAEVTSRGTLQRQLKTILDRDMTDLRAQRAAALSKQRADFAATRTALIARQDGEKMKMREAWRQHYERRPAGRGRKPYWKAQEKPAPASRENPLPKKEFDRARAPTPEPRKVASAPEYVARPAPAPSPTGEAPQPPKRSLQEVPQVERQQQPPASSRPVMAKDWDAAAKPQQQEAAPPPKDWGQEKPAPAQPEMRKDWSERAFEKGRGEIKPLPARDRSRDDGPER